ncbi:hypothetical protein K2F43_00905 [Clostridium estertheticum]|uniref:hypothetical protein n=1 Tax=Clostridium estertheticum TaxID=238834 RepID=UPI001C6F4AF1|nr:hypothetical protein [Clostridium estertheticum]MBW9169760.1 hypothetical protein [Clostridium estertheticum]WLC74734.1 hypothetical protein KTC99_18560 [Clostridium estertheticum]
MTVLERFKLELSKKEYYTDVEYTVFLNENSLIALSEYDKSTMQRNLLFSVVAVFETLSNDVDVMRKIDVTGVTSVDVAIAWINKRVIDIKTKISTIEVEGAEEFTNVGMLFSRNRR